MERKEIFERLNVIFADILDLEQVNLMDQTCSDDIDEWDSLSHIQLIVAIEKAFGLKFKAQEMISWNNVGAMVDSIQSKS